MPDIVLECKPDETLIKALGFTRKMIIHQPNKGQVINFLEKNPDAIGLVDEDPGSSNPTYLSKFQHKVKEQYDIQCLHIPRKGTRLIVIRPRLEEWILKHVALSQINLKNYSLPDKGKDLHKVINGRLSKFESMVKEMLSLQNEALLYLKKAITEQ